jgi:hypothetical protein
MKLSLLKRSKSRSLSVREDYPARSKTNGFFGRIGRFIRQIRYKRAFRSNVNRLLAQHKTESNNSDVLVCESGIERKKAKKASMLVETGGTLVSLSSTRPFFGKPKIIMSVVDSKGELKGYTLDSDTLVEGILEACTNDKKSNHPLAAAGKVFIDTLSTIVDKDKHFQSDSGRDDLFLDMKRFFIFSGMPLPKTTLKILNDFKNNHPHAPFLNKVSTYERIGGTGPLGGILAIALEAHHPETVKEDERRFDEEERAREAQAKEVERARPAMNAEKEQAVNFDMTGVNPIAQPEATVSTSAPVQSKDPSPVRVVAPPEPSDKKGPRP